jgi:hypothetical protein
MGKPDTSPRKPAKRVAVRINALAHVDEAFIGERRYAKDDVTLVPSVEARRLTRDHSYLVTEDAD